MNLGLGLGHFFSPHHDIVEVHHPLNHAAGTRHRSTHLLILVPVSCEDITRLVNAPAVAASPTKLKFSLVRATFGCIVELPWAAGGVIHIVTFVRGAVLV